MYVYIDYTAVYICRAHCKLSTSCNLSAISLVKIYSEKNEVQVDNIVVRVRVDMIKVQVVDSNVEVQEHKLIILCLTQKLYTSIANLIRSH